MAYKECACGCGGRATYTYIAGHRPLVACRRCGKEFTPSRSQVMCSQCRRHVKEGGPLEQNQELIHARRMQAKAPEGKKWCGGCQKYRALKFFGRDKTHYYSRCKPCFKRQSRERMLPKTYGITIDQYEALKEIQGGRCAICQRATGASKALAVDHDHRCCKGKGSCGNCVRGLLCSTCNNILGFARDDPALFKRAIEYLASPPFVSML